MSVRKPRRVRKSHLIALNQQLMALAVVLVMSLAAASVLSLDMVGPDAGGRATPQTVPAITEGDAYVATAPVKPKVREVAVHTAATATRAQAPAPGSNRGRTRAPSTGREQAASSRPASPTEAGLRLATTTGVEHVAGLGTVGVTWAESDVYAEDEIRVDVRSRSARAWSTWQKVEYHDDHGPDAGEASGERTLRAGTEPTVVGHVSGVQVRVFTRTGRTPTAMRVVLIDPGADREVKRAPAIDTADLAGTKDAEKAQAEQAQKGGSRAGISLSAMRTAPKPQIFSRAQWGADEKIREQSAPSYGTIQTGFVHHTVNANNYTAEQVPALLRGIYAYHVLSRGWRDIGYNFLVDRFGRIWEGRYGGVDKAVVGAHTLGYNEVSFAMSAIGNYDIAKPPQAVIDAYARLFAWKLSMYDIPADASGLRVKGTTLHAINGHRDVGQTACPGRYLYARIPDIRAAAAKIQRGGGTTPTPPPTPTQPPTTVPAAGLPVPADRLAVRSSLLGDRWPDLLVRDAKTKEVSTVPTTGQFAVGKAVATDGSWSRYDQVLAVGDTNGDGNGDVLTRVGSSGLAGMRYGNGDGTFGARVNETAQFVGYTALTAAGDMDADGRPDVVGVRNGRIMLFRGAPHGTYLDPVQLGSGYTGGRLVGVGDVVAGATPDLAYVDSSRHLVVLPGQGAALGAAQVTGATVPAGMNLLGAADANGDGVRDLLVRDGDAVRVMPGLTAGGFGTPQSATQVLTDVSHVSVGASFGAGAGIVGVSASGPLKARPVSGRIRMGTPVPSGRTLSDAEQLLSPGDWNGDGKADLISVTSTHAVGLRLGDGAGHYGAWTTMKDEIGSGTVLSAAGDVNGDGHPDLIARGGKGGLLVYRGDGKHGFLTPMRVPATLRSYNQIGSGTWSSTAGSARLVSSDHSFVASVGAVPSWKLARYDWVVGHGDVDGDGRSDLMVRDKANHGIYLLPGAADGGFGTLRYLGPGFADDDLGG